MAREIPEWRGKTDDSAVPPRVRLRVFNSHDGICYLSKRKIRAGERWQIEHKIALCNGGENRETNLAPALVEPHKEKTARDVAQRTKTDRIRKKHLGIKGAKWRPMQGSKTSAWKKKLDGTVVRR